MKNYRYFGAIALSVGAIIALSACSTRSRGGVETVTRTYSDGTTTKSSNYISNSSVQTALERMATYSVLPVDQARALVSGKTSLSYDLGMNFGNQIEYNAPDGTNYLWFPGNKVILKAKWEIRTIKSPKSGKELTAMCYQYGTNTYNPATNESGGNWECESFGRFMHSSVDRKDGDVFGISKTVAVPHVLDRMAVQNYLPHTLPVDVPYLTNGKSPIEHLQEDFAKMKTQ